MATVGVDTTSVFADGLLDLPPVWSQAMRGGTSPTAPSWSTFRIPTATAARTNGKSLLSGFGTEDTHHILHTLWWGSEGLPYFNQSIYIHSHIETPYGVRRKGGGRHPAIPSWKWRARRSSPAALVNPWGHHFNDWGQSFATDGAFGEGINYVFPGATFCTAPGASRILKGLNPGSPKHCSLEIVDGRHLPDDWQGSMITNDFRAHRVCRFVVSEEGSGYSSREQEELIKTTHVAEASS